MSVSRSRARRAMISIAAMMAYQGFTMAINGVAAPWIARSFGLGESGIAGLYAWISISAIGALVLSRLADRIGRRRILLGCMVMTPLCALGAAVSLSMLFFAFFEIGLYACIGATVAGSVVMLAEELPVGQRARGQSLGGLAMALGSGVCVFLMPLLDRAGWSWRWLLVLSSVWLVSVPAMARTLPESQRWQEAAARGATREGTFYGVFAPRYRRRSVPILVSLLLSTIAATAASGWSYFHAVSVVGLSSSVTSAMIIIGGGLALAGFPAGAWTADRFGRVPTVVGFGLSVAVGVLWFYWGPPAGFNHPALWLGAGFFWFNAAGNAAMVGGNSAATELFPTALRGTMIGWFALMTAFGSVISQAVIAVTSGPMGGLSVVVGYLALLAVPAVLIFGAFVDETRGLSLEAAAGESA